MTTIQLISPAGFGPVTPFDKTKHAGLGLKAGRNYAWCAKLNAVPVTVAEFGRVALDYPLAFMRDPRSGEAVAIAVLSLRSGENLFVNADGQWREASYVPAQFRRHPFCIVELPPKEGQPPQNLVCVQEDQLEASSQPFIDSEGKTTAAWEPIQKLLEAVEGSRKQTLEFAKRIDTAGLLVPFDALAMPTGGGSFRLQGLLRVDEQKLAQTPGRELKAMAERGELRAIYAHLISLENFARLLDLTRISHGN